MNQKFPEPTVGALIINSNDEILLVKSHKWIEKKWTVPGGHIELGETAHDAIIREVKEETNLDIIPVKPILVQECVYDEGFFKSRHFIFIDFLCNVTNPNQVKLDDDELQEYAWINIDEIDENSLEKFTCNLFRHYKSTNESADFFIDGNK
ncbi:MAG: NUDIX domain-containing protein [Thermoproteota archaeon]